MAKIEPYKPRSSVIAPHKSEPWSLDASEQNLFDSFAQEQTRRIGTDAEFFSLSLPHTKMDPLYNEATEHVFVGPFKLKLYLSLPGSDPNTEDRGYHTEFPAECWISRKELEDAKAPMPSEGDVITVWDIPYFRDWSDDGANIPGTLYAFNIADVDDDGHMFDNPNFVGYHITLRRTTTFTPERRTGADQP